MPDNGEAIQPTEDADGEGSWGLAVWRSRARSLTGEVRANPARWCSLLFVALASAAFAVWLLNLSRQQWFVTDEFDYFNPGRESLVTWLLRPHNEHTIAFTKAWFGLISGFVGLRHYELYMLPLVTAHLVVVSAIYRLTWISTASRVMATGTALVSLAMGAAVGTLTWAGQFQYVGSVAAGLTVILLAVQGSTRRAAAVAIALTVFGTLNGTAFVAFGLSASIVYARRRLWWQATLVALIPIGWELGSRVVWATQDSYAAHGLGQILREGPAVAYAILDTAISQTLRETHSSSAVLTALVLGTLALISANVRSRRTASSRRVVAALAIAAALTMLSLLVARLGLGSALSTGGGYSYLFLASLLPVGGILLGQIARSKAALLGTALLFVTISSIGVNTISDNAASLQSWKINGAHLMQTAAAELNAGIATFSDQIPVPDTAPTVSQEHLRSLAASGQLDAVITAPIQADQVSLNMQWRLASTGQKTGVCRDLGTGDGFPVPAGASVSIRGLSPGATVDLRYANSTAVRQFGVPTAGASLQTLSQRTAVLTVETASVRVCFPSSE